jgi:ABC-type phosphate transport system auxiliary subunit
MPGFDRPPIVVAKPGIAPGLPGIWTTALATLLVLVMLVLLLWVVTVNAFGWFWPSRIFQLTFDDGTVRVGQIVGREEIPESPVGDGTRRHRIQLKTGNREATGSDFLWVDEHAVVEMTTPVDLVRVIRSEYGDAFGRIVSATNGSGQPVDPSSPEALEQLLAAGADWRRQRVILERELER